MVQVPLRSARRSSLPLPLPLPLLLPLPQSLRNAQRVGYVARVISRKAVLSSSGVKGRPLGAKAPVVSRVRNA